MSRKRLFLYSFFFFAFAAIATTAIAGDVTRIQFAKGSYCGGYSGNFAGGKRFVLRLGQNQVFISRNTGNSDQLNVYVTGPTGQIPGEKTSNNEIQYRTTVKGDYEIMVVPESSFSSVEFCVYGGKKTPKNTSMVQVPNITSGCVMDVDAILHPLGLKSKAIPIHGPNDEDSSEMGCPYRQSPKAGTMVKKGTVIKYRYWYEGG